MEFNIRSFIKGTEEEKNHTLQLSSSEQQESENNTTTTTSKRGRKKKEETTTNQQQLAIPIPSNSMSYVQENIPYASAYVDTNKQLDDSIAQLDILSGELFSELQNVKNSKTLKNKYGYMNDMTSTMANLISTKISAIREKNKSINDANHLELNRIKELKTSANAEDDNTRIANLYDAFINTPVGVGPRPSLAPSIQDMVMPQSSPSDVSYFNIGGMNDQQIWEANLSPSENRMVLDAKGLIDTVVMYDEATGNRWFEVIDKTTGQPMANVEKPDSTYIYELDINVRNGYAKDSNINKTYPLIVINSENNQNLNKY
jgi:hypothetical protein